ncbi:LysR family transcriptional regulator [Streptococcus merionis]|uniref:LysR family transcriptional regulator n=1 Tax=Streptococcus merionis TaxID=400065 RepID=UPI0026F0B89B|nr:LysR family transcriptional regulator [Streptococcus merionis]
MEERDFHLLETLYQTGNITRAADQLYVTQSALSKRIAAIEEELQVPLLVRSRLGTHFTPEGELVLQHARQAAQSLERMRESLEAHRGIVSGTLKLGVSIEYTTHRLPDSLVNFKKAYPHVNVQVITDQSRKLYQHLVKGTVDIAILRGEYNWKEHSILLSRENVCAVCAIADKDVPLSDLPYIERKTDANFEKEIAQWIRENKLSPKPSGLNINHVATCIKMVEAGLGWAIVPEIALEHFKGHARPLFFENGAPFVRPTSMYYSNSALKLKQVQAFIMSIQKSIS